jgi:hypothetical protein
LCVALFVALVPSTVSEHHWYFGSAYSEPKTEAESTTQDEIVGTVRNTAAVVVVAVVDAASAVDDDDAMDVRRATKAAQQKPKKDR